MIILLLILNCSTVLNFKSTLKMLKIIHLSDFHLEKEKPNHIKKAIIDSLSSDLKSFVDEKTILCFTGDLVDKGGKDFEDNELMFLAFEELLLKKIIENNPLLNKKVFIVPGNHDIQRNKVDNIEHSGLKNALQTENDLDEFINKNSVSSKYFDRLANYKQWETTFYKDYPNAKLTNFDNSFILNIDEKVLGISCFNSSWLCYDDSDKGNILLGKQQVQNSLEFLAQTDYRIALIHHPLEFYKEFDYEAVKPLLYRKYNLMLTGHVHKLDSEFANNLNGNIFINVANSTIGDNIESKKYITGYSIITIDNKAIKVDYRKYVEDKDVFVPNTDIGTEDGSKIFPLLSPEKIEAYDRNNSIVSSIINREFDNLNDHILMSSKNTDVKCTIDNIFVEPRILNNPKDSLKKEDTETYTIESILNDNKNYLIYGVKESGKTLLTDKIFIEATRKFNETNSLAILLNFSDIKTKNLDRIFREYFSISSAEFNDFIKSNNFTLIIDDVCFKEKNDDTLFKIKEFIKNKSNIRIICTSIQLFDTIMPTEYLSHNDSFDFNVCFIQDFTSKEIKLLIGKWFEGKNVNLRDNMEKLLKSFYDFKLPKTPLSVTLFLWIFEKQEKKPINNSVLVELFIENILEKTNIQNIYSDSFDFTNKKRLLSFIALYMREKGNPDLSYSVSYVEIFNYVSKYLEKKISGKPEKILEDFIKRGIFIYEEDYLIRFKVPFVFHFFLSLQFDYNPEFKQYVFNDENYLNYIEEIEYYTGLKRDNVEILKFTQEKLEIAFDDFNNDINENYERIDKVLESKKERSVTFQIDEKAAKKKITEDKIDEIFDNTLDRTPIQKDIANQDVKELDTKKNLDTILKLSGVVLKNSEDIDDFNLKKKSYSNVIQSSISFLMQYRDALILYYIKHKKEPEHFPKNIDFHLFIRVLPLIHQNLLFSWLGSQKMRPVIEDKIQADIQTINISEFEKYISIFLIGDIKGRNYPETIKSFVKKSQYNYIKDISFLKILSYYHLRKNSPETDELYLNLLSEIKSKLGDIPNAKKGEFIKKIKDNKSGKGASE